MAVLDLFLILCYLLAMVGIGVYFSRKNKSSEQFTTAQPGIDPEAVVNCSELLFFEKE